MRLVQLLRSSLRSAAATLMVAILVCGCATPQREQARSIGAAGRDTMAALDVYYAEMQTVAGLQLRENMLRQALEVDAQCARLSAETCEAERKRVRVDYEHYSGELQKWISALQARRELALEAEQLYVQYDSLAADDFAAKVAERSTAVSAAIGEASDNKLPDAAVGQVTSSLAGMFEQSQLEDGERVLESLADFMSRQFTAERRAWDTLSLSYERDFSMNTSHLLQGGFASDQHLGGSVLASRELDAGSNELRSAPAVRSALVAFAAEDAARYASITRAASSAAQRALTDLVAAHEAFPEHDAIGRAVESADRLTLLVEELAAYRAARQAEAEEKKAKTAVSETAGAEEGGQ
jgi:hypothetical protein